MNIKEYKVPQILFIKGVFLKDCTPIDDIFERQLLDKLDVDTGVVKCDKIPPYFNKLSLWIKSINIKCWYCDLTFSSVPVFIPKIVERLGNDTYNISTYGCFCSFPCAQEHINIHNTKICDHTKFSDMLKFLYWVFNNKRIREIPPAPSKYAMENYGGDESTYTYKEKIKKLCIEQL
jgi:hypothetical protein